MTYPRATYDSPWKSILDHYLHAFLELVFPALAENINWGRGYELFDAILALPQALKLQCLEEIEQFEREKHMPYITSAERIGIQKGLEQGRQMGIDDVLTALVLLKKCTPLEEIQKRISRLSLEEIRKIEEGVEL